MRLREALDRMRVHASVAGGAISGVLHDSDKVDLSFAPGQYDRISESAMTDYLVSLARVIHAQYVRQYFQAVSEASGRTITKESPAIGRQDKEYAAQRQELVAEGRVCRRPDRHHRSRNAVLAGADHPGHVADARRAAVRRVLRRGSPCLDP
jgi:hypothetical protein